MITWPTLRAVRPWPYTLAKDGKLNADIVGTFEGVAECGCWPRCLPDSHPKSRLQGNRSAISTTRMRHTDRPVRRLMDGPEHSVSQGTERRLRALSPSGACPR